VGKLRFVNLKVDQAEQVFQHRDDVHCVNDAGDVAVNGEAENHVERKYRLAEKSKVENETIDFDGIFLFSR